MCLIHLNIIFLIGATTNMSKPPQQNKFPACNIFHLPIIFGMTLMCFIVSACLSALSLQGYSKEDGLTYLCLILPNNVFKVLQYRSTWVAGKHWSTCISLFIWTQYTYRRHIFWLVVDEKSCHNLNMNDNEKRSIL